MSKKKVAAVTLGPASKAEADALVKRYRADGYQAKAKERPDKPGQDREGQYMVEVTAE